MNDKVVAFPGKHRLPSIQKAPGQDGLMTEGPIICTNCSHRWDADILVGVRVIDCPSCGAHKGVRRTMIEPELMWRCNCGNTLFTIAPTGCYCIECGTIAIFSDVE